MSTTLRRRIRHARRWTGYGCLMVLIALALLVGVANQLLPMVERHPERIAAWLSARVGEPVSFSSARAEWTRRGPRFILEGLHVGEGRDGLDIGHAQLQVAMYSGLLPGRPLTELAISDLALTLVQAPDGRWEVVGLPGQGRAGADPLDRLEGFGELQITKARLAIVSPALRIHTTLPRIDARVRLNGPRVRVGVSAWAEHGDAPLMAVLDFDRQRNDGLVWIGGDRLVLAHWSGLAAAVGIAPQQGTAQVGLWANLRDRRISQVTVEGSLASVRLASTVPVTQSDGSQRVARVAFEQMQLSARWKQTANGWQVVAPRLNITAGGRQSSLDQLVLDGGKRFRLRGPELDLYPLAAMLSLSDRLSPAARSFLQQSNPQAVLRQVDISGERDGPMRGAMQVSGLSLQAHGQRPGLSGLAGALRFDERGAAFRFDAAPVVIDWPVGLRQQVPVRLSGSLAAWKDGAGWAVGSHALRVLGDGFGARLRLQLGFQGDSSAPTLDLAADLDPATFATVKKFWVLHRMPASTVKWLDNALVDGDVLGGRIALGGDLDDWPFVAKTGSFDARASIRNAKLKFNAGWPAGENLAIDVAFNGPGFSLEGNGDLLGNRIEKVSGGIEHFGRALLQLDIQSRSQGEALRQLMLASPLQAQYGEHLRAASITGDAAVSVALRLPLSKGLGERDIQGMLALEKATLADSRWDLHFTQVSGNTRFSHDGFATQDLKVRLDNQPAVFNLRVGAHTGDKTAAALASLAGTFTASSLLDRYAELAWLKPRMVGSSLWHVDLRIPAQGKQPVAPPSQLSLRSDLVGTALKLPAPLEKTESVALPLDLHTYLPIERGDINLRLGSLMRLRGRIPKGLPLTGVLQFGDGPMSRSPASGLSIRGQVFSLDSNGWMGFAGQGSGGDKSPVNDIDVQASKLLFLDRPFADARVQLTRGAALTQVVIKGKGIEGTVEIPEQIERGVQGRFAKLHLPSDAGDAAGGPAATASTSTISGAAAVVETDPTELPPLRFNIADLRIGQAQLGKAELVTTPIAAGLRVDKFQTQARNLRLSAAGEWVRTSGGSRSNFKLDFNANSLGQMLDALGYKDMVQGGKTKASLTGSWAGSPGAFSLSGLSGLLKAEVGEGRLLDVEPGGSGRILGLISLAEIPRRLSLDFSDFFEKGFSFNTATGDFAFDDGRARTENLRIDGPAAEIRVSGNTGLRDQVYDQRVEVLPKAGGLLPAIGLIAGGPAGAAVGAVAQAVFQSPLKQTTRVVYRVTGPWQKPEVEVIEKGPSRPPAAASASRGPTGQP